MGQLKEMLMQRLSEVTPLNVKKTEVVSGAGQPEALQKRYIA